MSDRDYHDLYEYRLAIRSDTGPDSATMRHVLLTLSQFMGENLYCYPSIKTLAAATALNEKTVRNQLTQAVNQGWIKRGTKGFNGQGWKLYEYVGTIPEHTEFNTAPSVDNSRIDAQLPEPNSKRAVSNYQNVRKEVPTKRSVNNSNNRSINNGFLKKHLQDKKKEVKIDPKFNPLIELLVIRKMVNNKEMAKTSIAGWIKSKGEEKVYEAYIENKDINENFFEQFYGSLKCNG